MFIHTKQQKKGIGPVISITLLLLVSILGMVFLSSWYSSFQSDFNSKVSVPQNEVEIKGLVDNFLFVRSYSPYNLSYNAIKIGNVDCARSGILNSNDFNKINLSNCTKQVPNGVDSIIIISDVGVFSKNLVINNVYAGCLLNATNLLHGQNYNFYNSSFVTPGNTCSYSNRFCSDGVLNGSSNFNISSCYVQDFTPDAFYFTNQTGVSLNTNTPSNILTPTGYTGPLLVSITGSGSPQLSVNGGAFSATSTMVLGDTLQLRVTSSSSYLTSNVANITLGNFSSLYDVKTMSAALVCPSNYIRVNGSNYGSLGFANYDFCVMETEATCNEQVVGGNCANNNYLPVVNNSNGAWTLITQSNAKLFCSNLGTGYHLVTLNESMLINRIIENDSTNWANGIKYSTVASGGGIYRGNVGTSDSVSCNPGSFQSVGATGTGCGVGGRNKRTLNLSSKLIWDWSGNVWEWLQDTCDTTNWFYSTSNIEWTDSNLAGIARDTAGPKFSYDSSYGFGLYKKGCVSTGYPFLRGGNYYGGSIGGIYATRAYTAGSWTRDNRGFRCSYS